MSIDRPLDPTLSRMDYGRALKAELLMKPRPDHWVPYAQPLLDAVGLFDELHIGYAVIGGIAAMFYGQPRFTEDVGFVAVTGHMDILSKNPATLEKFHFDPDCSFNRCHRSGIGVDLWKDEHADGIVARALDITMADRRVTIIEPHDLIAMKLRSGRLKDDSDISEIVRSNDIDDARIRPLVTPEQLSRLDELRRRS